VFFLRKFSRVSKDIWLKDFYIRDIIHILYYKTIRSIIKLLTRYESCCIWCDIELIFFPAHKPGSRESLGWGRIHETCIWGYWIGNHHALILSWKSLFITICKSKLKKLRLLYLNLIFASSSLSLSRLKNRSKPWRTSCDKRIPCFANTNHVRYLDFIVRVSKTKCVIHIHS